MSEEQRRQLQQQLWNIANALRGKMNADEFRDYILGYSNGRDHTAACLSERRCYCAATLDTSKPVGCFFVSP